MRFPHLFVQVHQREIESCFHKYGPVFRIVPKEPLGAPIVGPGDAMDHHQVTVVTVSCINDRGVLRAGAFSKADYDVAAEWAKRHKSTPVEDFSWLPSLEA